MHLHKVLPIESAFNFCIILFFPRFNSSTKSENTFLRSHRDESNWEKNDILIAVVLK